MTEVSPFLKSFRFYRAISRDFFSKNQKKLAWNLKNFSIFMPIISGV